MTLQKTNSILTHSNKSLSVQISLTGLSFLVSASDTKETLFLLEKKFDNPLIPEEIYVELEALISSHPQFQANFEAVTLVYATDIYSLVPLSLFDEAKSSDYLKFNSKILANDFIAHDALDNFELVIVYVPFVNLNNYFFDRFGSFQYYHATTVLIKSLLEREKNNQHDKVYVHMTHENFDLIVIKKGTLQLCNTYSFKSPEDFLYYVLFALEQLKLNPEIVETTFCGDLNKDNPCYELAYQYIRNISILDAEGGVGDAENISYSTSNFLLKTSL